MKMLVLNQKIIVSTLIMMLLICGVQGVSYGQRAVTIDDDWTCTIDWEGGQTLQLTVQGTVRATKNVQAVVIRAFVVAPHYEEFLGDDQIGDLSAGESKNFEITEVVIHGGRIAPGTVSCSVLPPLYNLLEPDPPDNNEQPGGTTYEFGDVIRTLPTDLTPSDVDDFDNAGMSISSTTTDGTTTTTRITRFGKDGYIVVDDITYICVASGGCRIDGRQVTQGRIQSVHSDLVVEQVSVSKSTLAPGETFTLSATVRNQGTDSAAATTLAYRYFMFDVDGTVLTDTLSEVGTDDVSALGANESSVHSISLTASTSAGAYFYGACVGDSENPRSNNCEGVEITVEPPPESDLVVEQPSVSKSALGPGEDFTLSATVRNQGESRADGTTLRYYRSTDTTISTRDTEVGTDGVGALGANQTGDENITLTAPTSPGTYYYGACVGSVDNETATANNCSEAVSITVEGIEFDLTVSAGTNLIHVPLKVTAVDGVAKTVASIADLYDALGGASSVSVLITYDADNGEWRSYADARDRGTPVDKPLTDDAGIIAIMKAPMEVRLRGDALGTNGSSAITLMPGLNLVGLPLRDPQIARVSDLLALDGIRGNVPVIILSDGGDFKSVGRAGDPGDIAITGGQSFILTAQQAGTVAISGEGWSNISTTAAAPQMLTGIEGTDTTPVLALRGSIVDEVSGVNRSGFRVAVENLSTGRQVAAAAADAEAGYRLTVVDIETMRAARVGDVLEITARSTNPFIGVKPLRYTVTALDVRRGLIRLPELIVYEIPKETELLANYPNPFNPETWIPYRLAEDAEVSLTIYDQTGRVVRSLDVGYQVAGVYESRSKAVYWDGRNEFGETVASGVYFYHLSAGDFFATRKMLILK